ncbi:hypothetical protein [Trebonia kvetii]|uniref:hypothetical protein n=1 Tax=Trebonia kvetii TaxID=2480626 RepID=UPI001FE901F9|nr:hypothetical protein [Trebonia kvetii]
MNPGDHVAGELGYQRNRVVGRRRCVGHAERVHAEQPPGPLGAGRSQVGATMLLGPVDDRRRYSVARDATTARVLALEALAEHVAVAEAARRDWRPPT